MSLPDYGFLSRTLHRLALGPEAVRSASYDMEQAYLSRQQLPALEQPVFVSGLARSGSTVLLNTLYRCGVFRSLTYRDMPFVLMPGLWKKLSASSRSQMEARERAHGDRIKVDYDSPEAFEEIFWKTFCGRKYLQDNYLRPHKVGKTNRDRFRCFIQSVIASDSAASNRRYLSKNNNNILRFDAINTAFPDAIILVPFRKPIEHARSLLNQHERFSELHQTDRFGLDYMHWLGHFEFGLGHKPFRLSGEPNPYQPMDINYWLWMWHDVYAYLLAQEFNNTWFIGHEQACRDSTNYLLKLAPVVGVEADILLANNAYEASNGAAIDQAAFNSSLIERCNQVYEALCGVSLSQ